MLTTTRETALWMSDAPCYTADSGYSLTLYVAGDGMIMPTASSPKPTRRTQK